MTSCVVCDSRIDPCGRDGARCDRCYRPCDTCGGDVMLCAHPLPAAGVPPIPVHHLAHLLEGAPL